ncbi:hypothetical protein AVEN_43810-1 [Araneus ventricosus]|uniref:Reverse transcriptase zinc-binding domain-containing protein n=1 Tax=Araneus ventricosus TaxID=182803 RepID=A0A4Y2LHU5_ARAVE|nr:hypothetical protein AVEN_43810-1 [Araneus ventricosus]
MLKKKLHSIWIRLSQNEWFNGDNGRDVHLNLPWVKTSPAPWQIPEIMFATGHDPFPAYLKRFRLITIDCCVCGELRSPLHLATTCPFTSSFHLTKLSNDLEHLCWKRNLNVPLSRIKMRKLNNCVCESKDILFPPN